MLDEPNSDRAAGLYARSITTERPLLAPSLLRNEVANAVYRQLRRGLISETTADAAIARFSDLSLDVQFVDPPGLAERAYILAKRHRLGAIDDSLYVVLAEELVADLWTDDRKLINAVARTSPWVRWIGDYPTDPS